MWFNPIMKTLLKSPLHFFASGNTMLLTYRGNKSYLDIDGALYTISSRDRVWWRNLRQGEQVGLRLAGRELTARAVVIEDRHQVSTALGEYLRCAPERARYLGVKIDPSGNPEKNDLKQLADEKVVVKFVRDQS